MDATAEGASMNTDPRENSFTVCLVRADGGSDIVCHDASSIDAAKEFWHRSHNVSAIGGMVRGVSIVDNYGCTNLAWEFGRGFTFDGRNFHSKPVIMGRHETAP